jgi:hypothetical protein
VDESVPRKLVEDTSGTVDEQKEETDDEAEKESSEWVELYTNGKASRAAEILTKQLAKNPRRSLAARLYNNRGYIRYEMKDEEDAARRDLERARDLHFYELP